MTTREEPPGCFDAYAVAAWRAGLAAIERAGLLGDVPLIALEVLAGCASDYVRSALSANTATPRRPPDDLALVRVEVRKMMTLWLLLDPADEVAGPLRADGLDPDIAALCGLRSTVH